MVLRTAYFPNWMRTVEVQGEVYVLGVTGNTEYLRVAYVPRMKSDSKVLQSVCAAPGMTSPVESLQLVLAVEMKSDLRMEEEYCVPPVKLAGLSESAPLSPGLLSPALG